MPPAIFPIIFPIPTRPYAAPDAVLNNADVKIPPAIPPIVDKILPVTAPVPSLLVGILFSKYTFVIKSEDADGVPELIILNPLRSIFYPLTK